MAGQYQLGLVSHTGDEKCRLQRQSRDWPQIYRVTYIQRVCRTLKLVITTLAIVCVADMVNHSTNVVIHINILLTGQGCGRFH